MDELERAATGLGRLADVIAGGDDRLRGSIYRALVDAYFQGRTAGRDGDRRVLREWVEEQRTNGNPLGLKLSFP